MAKREMTEDQKAAIAAARIAQAEETRKQRTARTYVFAPYRVFWFDEENWCVQDGDDENKRWYYPTLDYCFRHVLHKQISERNKVKATDLLATIQSAEKQVMETARKYQREAGF